MTRNEAARMVQHFFLANDVVSEGLNEKNLGGAQVGDLQVFFQYLPDMGILRCSAHIYSFHDAPKPGVLEGFKKAADGGADTGGGYFEYQPENRGIYLSRDYKSPAGDEEFLNDLARLMGATREWGGPILEKVAAAVFHN